MMHKRQSAFQKRGSSVVTGDHAPVILTGYRSIEADWQTQL